MRMLTVSPNKKCRGAGSGVARQIIGFVSLWFPAIASAVLVRFSSARKLSKKYPTHFVF